MLKNTEKILLYFTLWTQLALRGPKHSHFQMKVSAALKLVAKKSKISHAHDPESLTPFKALTHIISSNALKQKLSAAIRSEPPPEFWSAIHMCFSTSVLLQHGQKWKVWDKTQQPVGSQEWNEGGRHKICSLSAASCWKSHRAGLPPAYSQEQVYISDLRECIKRPLERKSPNYLEIISVFVFVTENK